MGVGPQWSVAKQILSYPLLPFNIPCCRGLSNNIALVTKVHRESYLRTYPTLVVQADGSSFYVRYHEPRSIIQVSYLFLFKLCHFLSQSYYGYWFYVKQLPLDVSTLTPEELKIRIAKRNPKKKVIYATEEKDTYQASKYVKLVKKAKKSSVKN